MKRGRKFLLFLMVGTIPYAIDAVGMEMGGFDVSVGEGEIPLEWEDESAESDYHEEGSWDVFSEWNTTGNGQENEEFGEFHWDGGWDDGQNNPQSDIPIPTVMPVQAVTPVPTVTPTQAVTPVPTVTPTPTITSSLTVMPEPAITSELTATQAPVLTFYKGHPEKASEKTKLRIHYQKEETASCSRPGFWIMGTGGIQILSVRLNGRECSWHREGRELILDMPADRESNCIEMLALYETGEEIQVKFQADLKS